MSPAAAFTTDTLTIHSGYCDHLALAEMPFRTNNGLFSWVELAADAVPVGQDMGGDVVLFECLFCIHIKTIYSISPKDQAIF